MIGRPVVCGPPGAARGRTRRCVEGKPFAGGGPGDWREVSDEDGCIPDLVENGGRDIGHSTFTPGVVVDLGPVGVVDTQFGCEKFDGADQGLSDDVTAGRRRIVALPRPTYLGGNGSRLRARERKSKRMNS